jgi:hypothetical protein
MSDGHEVMCKTLVVDANDADFPAVAADMADIITLKESHDQMRNPGVGAPGPLIEPLRRRAEFTMHDSHSGQKRKPQGRRRENPFDILALVAKNCTSIAELADRLEAIMAMVGELQELGFQVVPVPARGRRGGRKAVLPSVDALLAAAWVEIRKKPLATLKEIACRTMPGKNPKTAVRQLQSAMRKSGYQRWKQFRKLALQSAILVS